MCYVGICKYGTYSCACNVLMTTENFRFQTFRLIQVQSGNKNKAPRIPRVRIHGSNHDSEIQTKLHSYWEMVRLPFFLFFIFYFFFFAFNFFQQRTSILFLFTDL
jgi:hypothetical protein